MHMIDTNRKRRTGAASEDMTKLKKQLAAVFITGLILLLADFAVSSSQYDLLTERSDGNLYITRPPEGSDAGRITLSASIQGKDGPIEKSLDLTVEPFSRSAEDESNSASEDHEATEPERDRIERQLRDVASDINSDTEKARIMLPEKLDTGESISWAAEESSASNAAAIIALTGIAAFCVYRSRHAAAEKQKKKEYESVMRQLPEFVNRLVLLLNAGLVLTNAFERSIEERFSIDDDDDYFYGRLKNIYIICMNANGSMHAEFRKMARESGIRELMRVANIMTDNIKKGVELTEKLRSESEMLWLERKKSCEERGRLAETKLTLPLMIFLMVLIVITVSPALINL